MNTWSEPLAVSVVDASKRAGVGRSTLYQAMKHGELPFLKIGARRLVLVETLYGWLKGRERPPQSGGAPEIAPAAQIDERTIQPVSANQSGRTRAPIGKEVCAKHQRARRLGRA